MSDYMPVEMLLKILEILPVKSLMRFRSVSKTWDTLISQSSFISSHLQASVSNNTPFLLIYETLKDYQYNSFLLYDNDGLDKFKQLQFPVFPYVNNIGVFDSCNGLICLMLFHYKNNFLSSRSFVLWNPLIQKYISLPQSSITEDVGFDFGFGFDSKTNDYKILMVGNKKDYSWIQTYLFSLNQNCWKRLSATPNDNYISMSRKLIFVNGAVHWIGYNARNYLVPTNVILGFDFSSEEFMLINLPENLIGSESEVSLLVMKYRESSIAVMRTAEHDELIELWAMKEYGVVESWTKLFAFEGVVPWPLSYSCKPELKVLGFRNNGYVLLEGDDGELVSLDLNGQQMESPEVYFKKTDYFCHYYLCGTHVQSLVLLDKAVDVHNRAI